MENAEKQLSEGRRRPARLDSAKMRVAIVGGGPSGLLLARILHLAEIEFAVFERDESPFHRPQGGMLDLHAETGQYALKRAGLFDEFKKFARYDDQGQRLFDQHGTLLFEKDAKSGDKPEIDRAHLREILLRSIPADAVRWGYWLSEVAQLDNGVFELRFGNGAVETFDFFVGADGAWSKVRALVTPVLPESVGLTLFELSIDDADARYPEIAELVGHGTFGATGGDKTILAQRNANAHIRVYAVLPEDDPALIAEQTRESLAAQFEGWDGKLLQLISSANEAVRPWPIYTFPVGHRWEARDGVTLIGDAAHLMPPAGEGANLALRDAADLGEALTVEENRFRAVRAFETVMFERASSATSRAVWRYRDRAGLDREQDNANALAHE
jgi:2-polyprenyl-6-methoxyphenol hydroxylase-like FAD-dependent oxidoreductase